MSVFRFEAAPAASKFVPRRTKGKYKESRKPTFAFSTSPSLLQDITLDKAEAGMRNSASSGLTMKEYEEQLKKLTAENFNLKLRVYFVEERLSKVTGISDKEDLIKKNIQLKVTCESQLKELEKKQELLFEASKAFELLQKEHAEEVEKLLKEKDKEIAEWEEKFTKLEAIQNEIKIKFPALEHLHNPDVEIKTFEDYEKQVADLESALRSEKDRGKELESMLKDMQLELESYELKTERMESEMDQRMHRVEELVDELEQKEHVLASANFRIRKLEDDLKSKQREADIMKERIEEKNKTIESLENSLASRYDTIESLENRIAKEKSSSQSMQSKLDSLSFQNVKLKEELEILQSRLRRTTDALSPRGKSRPTEEDSVKQKYEELLRTWEEQESQASRRIKELEEKLGEKVSETNDYHELLEKHKKLEDDHRKACTALKNFIKRSSDEKKEREVLNHMLNNHEEVIADLKAQLDRYRNNVIPRIIQDDKLSLAGTGENVENSELLVSDKRSYDRVKDDAVQGDEVLGEKKIKRDAGPDTDGGTWEPRETAVVPSLRDDRPGADVTRKRTPTKGSDAKKREIEELNIELKRRDVTSREVISKESRNKSRDTERLENYLSEITDKNGSDVMMMLQREIQLKDHQLRVLQDKLQELGIVGDSNGSPHLECKLLLGIGRPETLHGGVSDGAAGEVNVWSFSRDDEDSLGRDAGSSKELEAAAVEDACRGRSDVINVCSMLSLRLEELAAFLDSLLRKSELLSGMSLQRREDIREAIERSRELSRHLSISMAKKDSGDSSAPWFDAPWFANCSGNASARSDSSGFALTRDKVITEQTIIINRLREQLNFLNQEIKQRDIELSHCQGSDGNAFNEDMMDISDRDGIEKQTMSICQDLSDDLEEELNDWKKEGEQEEATREESRRSDKDRRKVSFSRGNRSRETSESDAWSEPDRSVSLARMGRLDDLAPAASHRNHKRDVSSYSSEDTLNENSRMAGGKRGRSAESEIRRLQSRVRALDEINEGLRAEIDQLKGVKITLDDSSKSLTLKSEDEASSLSEKLRNTMKRLDECRLTCRQLEEKLATALQRAAASVVQLSKATETIALLEREIARLNDELRVRTAETEEKNLRISRLESKIEEITIESELKLIEANKHRAAAERKTQEVECRLKDAENMSKEVESKVCEIEKKMSETKKTKKETVEEAEKHAGAAEKMMEEAERMKAEAERKSKDFQSFIDLMRKEVEEKLKEAERRIKKSEREKEESEKQVIKLKKRLMEAERNKTEVEAKVKEGKETIQCMEEKLRELEVAMDQCNEEAQRKIREIQKKAESKVADLEKRMEERERTRKSDLEKKMAEAEKISRELETGFRRQLEDAERKIKKAEATVRKAREDFKKQEAELKMKIADEEEERKRESAELRRKLDEAKLEASEFELELTRLTNEKIHLEEELRKVLDKESALAKDNKEIKGKYENSIHQLEEKLTLLTLNKSQLASRLEEIESTNIDLVTRISAIRGNEMLAAELDAASEPPAAAFSPPRHGSPLATLFAEAGPRGEADPECGYRQHFPRHGSAASDPGDRPLVIPSAEAFAPPRRHMSSSPDLGIDSDPGRFSSLEAVRPTIGDPAAVQGRSDEPAEMKRLAYENAELRRRLTRTRQALEETLTQLSAANQRKKQVERAICKQLHKTHHILKKARVNFESQEGGDSLE